jgi:hypothetical protein
MRHQQRRVAWATVACALIAAPVLASEHVMNTITRVERVADGVEIEVASSEPFPVRAMPPLVRVGDQVFGRSRSPADGSLNALIFMLSDEEFGQTSTGDPVSVGYAGDPPEEGRDFGKLPPVDGGGPQ